MIGLSITSSLNAFGNSRRLPIWVPCLRIYLLDFLNCGYEFLWFCMFSNFFGRLTFPSFGEFFMLGGVEEVEIVDDLCCGLLLLFGK